MNDVVAIIRYLQRPETDVNAVDFINRNALQAALYGITLKVETCRALIQLGINLEHKDNESCTVLAHLVYYYKHETVHFSLEKTSTKLELFRSMVEGGADLDVTYESLITKPLSIREKIRKHPELEAIVQEVNIQKANQVFNALQGDFNMTRIVCEMLGSDPGKNWKPLALEPAKYPWKKYGAWIAGGAFFIICSMYARAKIAQYKF